jgi:hypothetical protein
MTKPRRAFIDVRSRPIEDLPPQPSYFASHTSSAFHSQLPPPGPFYPSTLHEVPEVDEEGIENTPDKPAEDHTGDVEEEDDGGDAEEEDEAEDEEPVPPSPEILALRHQREKGEQTTLRLNAEAAMITQYTRSLKSQLDRIDAMIADTRRTASSIKNMSHSFYQVARPSSSH